MYSENLYKAKLTKLYQTNPNIHIDVTLERPHIVMRNVEARLIGAYKHIFQIEVQIKEKTEMHSLQYGDISAGIVKIYELI